MNKKSNNLLGGALQGGTSIENKTGSWRTERPVWDKKKCIQCMKCYNFCPENCILAIKKNKSIQRGETDLDFCKGCGICAEVCPTKAITMQKENDFDISFLPQTSKKAINPKLSKSKKFNKINKLKKK
ncbi:MAG TPA: 4Fe-4S binding protein [archaeon]|jgi:2-oxoacid:acceptor oxidoreductase delta subunit (pyruvate/2-ketoisovalerate family)|nr:4Fe-4S binding protein [archaeon]